MKKLAMQYWYRTVMAVDNWLHFHRFDCDFLCDHFERLNGVPRHILKAERKTPHVVGRSYRNHPSRGEKVP